MRSVRCRAVLLGLLGLVPLRLEAQGLVALLNPGGDRQLGALVPSSGNLHSIGPVIGGTPISTSGASQTIDQAGNRLFFVGTPNANPTKLFSISTVNGAVLASPNVSNAQNGIVFMDWDAGESKLFCLVSVGPGDRQLGTVNVATGAVTLLGSPIAGASLGTGGIHALDAAGNRYFFTGLLGADPEALYVINTTTGAEIASPILSGAIVSVRALGWDAAESVLFGLFGLADGDAQLGTVNTTTGAVSLRGNPLGGSALSTFAAALAPESDLYFFAGQPSGGSRTVYSISTMNGLEVESHEFTGSVHDVLTLQWDPGALFANGFNSGNTSAWSSVVP